MATDAERLAYEIQRNILWAKVDDRLDDIIKLAKCMSDSAAAHKQAGDEVLADICEFAEFCATALASEGMYRRSLRHEMEYG